MPEELIQIQYLNDKINGGLHMLSMIKKILFLKLVILVSTFSLFNCESTDPVPEYYLSESGTYTQCSYKDDILDSEAYDSAIVYYPCEISDGPFPATTLTGGITNYKEQVSWLAEHLVTHGYIIIAMTPTENLSLSTDIWRNAMTGGIDMLEAENGRSASPIFGLVDMDRLAIMGFSMGGGGTLKAVNEISHKVRTALSLAPHEDPVSSDMYENISVPTVVFTGTSDAICPQEQVWDIFSALPTTITRAYINVTDADHVDWMNMGDSETHARFATLVTSWLKYYLSGDASYFTYIDGKMHQQQDENGWFAEYLYY